MDVIQAIRTRRSVRAYDARPIPEAVMQRMKDALRLAPSACNSQPWQYIIVKDRNTLNDIMEVHPYTGMLNTANMAIIVCGEPQEGMPKPYWAQDCAASTQNILLEAKELGIGSCWCGVYPYNERVGPIRKLFKIPDEIYPFCVIALGYPAEEKPPNNRYIEDKIHNEKW